MDSRKRSFLTSPGSASAYNIHTGESGVATALALKAREKMYKIFIEKFKPAADTKILDVGVTCDYANASSNYFEQYYPFKEQITCVGTEDAAWLEERYPGLRFVRISPNDKLPFKDKQFDISLSNAVIEHVGSTCNQKKFVSELLRVSKVVFVTTPNRWFPIETHTMLPFLHFLPVAWWRKSLAVLGYGYYSLEENLNLLDKRSLPKLFPADVSIEVIGVKTLGFISNLVAFKTAMT